MSKDLNLEYKQHIEKDIPDLWNRIEAALPEKSDIDTRNINDSEMITVADENAIVSKRAGEQETTITSIKSSLRWQKKNTRIIIGIVAACACCAISIPAIMQLNSSSKMYEATANYANDSEATVDYAVAEESSMESTECLATEEVNMENGADRADYMMSEESSSDSSAVEMAEESNFADSEYTAMEEAVAETPAMDEMEFDENEFMVNQIADEGVASEMCEDAEGSAAKTEESVAKLETPEQIVLSEVSIIVENISEVDDHYYAEVKVLSDPNGEFETGDIIELDCTEIYSRAEGREILSSGADVEISVNISKRETISDTNSMYELLEILK